MRTPEPRSPKCLGGNLGDFGEFCKGLKTRSPYSLSVLPFQPPKPIFSRWALTLLCHFSTSRASSAIGLR
ncbi:hypothetical protein EWP18_02975 [Neisseria meningitidis]|nr:hypothetical protein A6J49_05865 [Neisseria meningitidis]MBG8612992.1 hypothetical protein [Neisseria meningitidis]MBG8623807.1 hypothetical protein [Neisseria meningitidis]MBG8635429.1 hypothetical protein [Neisseria meningitidis]MBG8643966.1 hypothetical protein [Neisseria meningitidis]